MSGLSAGNVKSVLTTFIRSFQCRSRIASRGDQGRNRLGLSD